MATKLTFNSLLGFSSFESVAADFAQSAIVRILSIPYWDFLVLNQGEERGTIMVDKNFQFPIGIF